MTLMDSLTRPYFNFHVEAGKFIGEETEIMIWVIHCD